MGCERGSNLKRGEAPVTALIAATISPREVVGRSQYA
jgi:hypothetical protein